MAESISEVFIRFGTQGVGDVMRQIQTLERVSKEMSIGVMDARKAAVDRAMAYSDMEINAELRKTRIAVLGAQEREQAEAGYAAAALAEISRIESATETATQEKTRLAQEYASRAIAYSDAEIDAELRKTRIAVSGAQEREQAERDVAAAAMLEMARIESAVETDQQEKARLAGEYVSRAMAYSAQEADAEIANTLRAFRVREETKQGVLALRNEMVERAIAHSNAELDAELRATRVSTAAAASEQRFLEALERSKVEMARSVADARKNENEDRLRSAAITRQQETAQENFNRKVAEYNRLRQLGASNNGISEQTYARAIAAANRELEHNIQLEQLGRRGILGRREALMQLSYGLQDIAITFDQGLGRALQASANNIGMIIPLMTKSIGLGIGLSVGFTALATAIAMWERSSAKANNTAEKQAKALDKLTESLGRYNDARRRSLQIQDIAAGDEPRDAAKRIEDLRREIETQRGARRVAVGVLAEQEAAETSRITGGRVQGSIYNEDAAKKFIEITAEKFFARRLAFASETGPVSGEQITEMQFESRIAAMDELMRVRQVIDATEAIAKTRKEILNTNQKELEAQRDIVKLREAERDSAARYFGRLRTERFLREFDEENTRRNDERREANRSQRDAISRINDGLMSDQDRSAMKVFDEFRANVEAIAGGTGMTADERSSMLGRAGSLFEADLAKLEKQDKRRFQGGFSGISDFGRQFQMALFQDPAEKDRKEQIRLQKEANDIARKMADSLAGGLPGVAVFAAGNQ